ncbi:uncharacterized protein [Atheta coriaria]|uniref:uncharacterized protein n=1 Tax=Dalotia coriaria TaxID=877792 RepID=UPI0031F39140
MVKRINKNHYVATQRHTDSPTPVHVARSVYSDGEESQRAPSERTLSEYTPYTVVNERRYLNARNPPPRASSALSRHSAGYDNGSDIYVTSGAYKSPSEISRSRGAPSHYSYRSARAPSIASTAKTRNSRKAGVTIETMAAPNPFCPNIKGMCCLMLLLNLGIILVTLGFVIVIQFFEPAYVWFLGIVFLIFGFLTLIGSLIYCVVVCRDAKRPDEIHPEDLYWTHHWQKSFGTVPPSEVHYKTSEKYADDRYSDRYSVSKLSGKYSNSHSRNGRY